MESPAQVEPAELAEIRKQHAETIAFGSPKQKTDLAQELMSATVNEQNPPPKRLAALKVAAGLFFELGNFDKPLETCDLVAEDWNHRSARIEGGTVDTVGDESDRESSRFNCRQRPRDRIPLFFTRQIPTGSRTVKHRHPNGRKTRTR
jgi:hypothetical protein